MLSIAGFDPSSGAGITADIKTIAAHGCYGIACITALTVQSTTGVRRVQPVSGEIIRETLNELAADFEIAAVRIGMLGSAEVAAAVADFLEKRSPKNVVLDPIMSSSSGTRLVDDDGFIILRDRLLPLSLVITPNVAEAAWLAVFGEGEGLFQEHHILARLHARGAANVVITHGDLIEPVDVLSVQTSAGPKVERFSRRKIKSKATHGTGCAFATALACNLALRLTLPDAVRLSGEYVRDAIAAAPKLGRGKGPMNHLFRLG